MERFFVRVTPSYAKSSQYFVAWAESHLEAACMAVAAGGLGPDDFDENDCVAVSQECIPVPGDIPSDLRYIPVQCLMLAPKTSANRRTA